MTFKVTPFRKVIYVLFFSLLLYFIYLTKFIKHVLKISTSIEITIIILSLVIMIIFTVLYNETYEIYNGTVEIKRGRKAIKIRISDVEYIYCKSSSNSRRTKGFIYTNIAYLVVNCNEVLINTDVRNNDNNNLVDILKSEYHKRIVYE